MLVASGAIDPAVICGLNPEHAKLLGLTTPKQSQVTYSDLTSPRILSVSRSANLDLIACVFCPAPRPGRLFLVVVLVVHVNSRVTPTFPFFGLARERKRGERTLRTTTHTHTRESLLASPRKNSKFKQC